MSRLGTVQGSPGELSDRWTVLLRHREQAFRVAQTRTSSREDAEDLVSEAMLRAAEVPALREETAGGLLTAIIHHLSIDEHRRRQSTARAMVKLVVPDDPDPADAVLDRAEATWLNGQAQHLPAQDREALLHRAAGHSTSSAAEALGVSYKAVESAYGRARGRLRSAWQQTLSVLIGCGVLARRLLGKAQPTTTAAAAVFAVGVLLLTLLPSVAPATTPAPSRKAVAIDTFAQQVAARALPVRQVGAMPRPSSAPGRGRGDAGADELFYTGSVGDPRLVQSGAHLTHEHQDESTAATVRRCLRDGVYLKPTRLGCRDDADAQPLLPTLPPGATPTSSGPPRLV